MSAPLWSAGALVVANLGRFVIVACDSPQLLLEKGSVACGLCFSCCKEKDDADRQRRYYWLKRKRGHVHV